VKSLNFLIVGCFISNKMCRRGVVVKDKMKWCSGCFTATSFLCFPKFLNKNSKIKSLSLSYNTKNWRIFFVCLFVCYDDRNSTILKA
jgi:hypothetical protein